MSFSLRAVGVVELSLKGVFFRLRHNTDLQRNAAFALASTFASATIALVASPILASLLPRSEYGTLNYLNRWIGLLAAFSVPGVAGAISYSVARGFDAEFYHATIFRLRIFLRNSLVFFPILIIVFWIKGDRDFIWLLLAGMLLGPLYLAFDTGEQFLIGKSDFSAIFWRRLAVTLITAIAGIALAIAFPTALAVFVGRSLFGTVLLVIVFRALLRTVKSHERDPTFWSKAKDFNVVSILQSVANLIDGLVLGTIGQFELLAAYALSGAIAAPLEVTSKSFIKLIYGRMVRTRSAREWRLMGIGVAGIIILGLPLLWGIWQVGAPLISMLYPKYPEILQYFPILLIKFVFDFAAALPATYGLFHKYHFWVRFNAAAAALRILVMVVSVLLWGVWGALYTRLAFSVATFSFFFVSLWRADGQV